MGAVYPLYYIVIGNRRKKYQERAITLTVEASLDGAVWQLIHTGLVSWDGDLAWPLGGQVSARYVRLSLREKNSLNLAGVEVWGMKEAGVKPVTEENEILWAETRPEGLKELGATPVEPSSPEELTIDLGGDFHSIWALELIKPPQADFDSFRNIKIESSIDGRDWQIIHEGLLFWPRRFYYPLQGEIIARFFRLSFPEARQAQRPQVRVFSRVYKLNVRATRRDGVGGRLITLLNAMYMAKLLNCGFSFNWIEISYDVNDSGSQQVHVDSVEKVFSAPFVQEHHLELPSSYKHHDVKLFRKGKYFHRHLANPSSHELQGVLHATNLLPTEQFQARLLPPDSYYKLLFETIAFSPEFKKIIDAALRADVPDDYTALHMRAGDVIHTAWREGILWANKTAPLQITKMALEKMNGEKRKVIVFGEDAEVLAYLGSVYTFSVAADYLPAYDLSPHQRDFFEAVLMSRATKIYACVCSMFSRFPWLIGGNIERHDLHKVASDAEKMAYMEADLKENERLYHPLHNAYSYVYLYHLTHQTAPLEKRLLYLERAMTHDSKNSMLKLFRAMEYFKEGRNSLGDTIVRELFCIDFDYTKMTFHYSLKNFLKITFSVARSIFTYHADHNYFKTLEEAARSGSPYAAALMAIFFETGLTGKKNGPESQSWKNVAIAHKTQNQSVS